MAEFTWTLQDGAGSELRTSEVFSTKEEAEAWMGAEWSALRDEGGEYVLLKDCLLYTSPSPRDRS